MSKFFVDGTDLTSVADAIREKGGTSGLLIFPDDFIQTIEDMSTGGISWEQPLERDFTGGYINSTSPYHWVPEDNPNNLSTIYELQLNHVYLLCLGPTVSTRFRASVYATDVRNATSRVDGFNWVSQNNPQPYAGLYYKNTNATYNKYLVILTSNDGTHGIMTYLLDVTNAIASITPPELVISDASYFFYNRAREALIPDIYQSFVDVENFYACWYGFCQLYGQTSINLSGLDLSHGRNFGFAFAYNSYLTSLSLPASIKQASIVNMNSMFYYCRALTAINGIDSLNLANLNDKGSMFSGCSSLTSLDLHGWNFGTKASQCSEILYGLASLRSVNVSRWIIPNANVFTNFARDCDQLLEFDCSDWENPNATGTINLNNFFANCLSIQRIAIGRILGSSNYGSGVFSRCSSLQELVILDDSRVMTLDANGITNSTIESATCAIYVPDALVADYKAATTWITDAANIYGISDYPGTPWWNAAQI